MMKNIENKNEDEDGEIGKYDFKDIKEIMKEEGKYEVITNDHKRYIVNGFKCHSFRYRFYEKIGNDIHYLMKLDYNKVINIKRVK